MLIVIRKVEPVFRSRLEDFFRPEKSKWVVLDEEGTLHGIWPAGYPPLYNAIVAA